MADRANRKVHESSAAPQRVVRSSVDDAGMAPGMVAYTGQVTSTITIVDDVVLFGDIDDSSARTADACAMRA